MGIKNLLSNSFNLLKSLIKVKGICWQVHAQRISGSNIDKGVTIQKPYEILSTHIGFGTAIGPHSNISYTSIGKFTSIGPNFLCGWGIHPVHGISVSPAFYSTAKQNGFTFSSTDKICERLPIRIGNDVFIGANVTVLDGISIGDGAVIGAGAVVSKHIPPYAIAVGSPIKIIRYRFPPEIIEQLLLIKWWDGNEELLKKVEAHFFDVTGFLSQVNADNTIDYNVKKPDYTNH